MTRTSRAFNLPAQNWQLSIEDQRAQACLADPSLPPCQKGIYGYILNYHANVAFLILFNLVFTRLICIAVTKSRAYAYSIAIFAGLAFEILGYSGRVWSANNQLQPEPFYMQFICLTIGPAFMAAAIYFCMRRIVITFGTVYSLISPKKYTRIVRPPTPPPSLTSLLFGTHC